jgi:hypothetical protein
MQVKGWPAKLEKYHEGLNYAEWSDRFDLDFKNRYDIIQSFIRQPSGWRGRVSMTDSTGIGYDFGWFSGADNDWAKFTPLSLYPGKTLQGAGLFRPELPGVGLLGMKGDTEERGRPGDFPASGPLAEKMDELEATEEITIPVLVPAVSIPVPYNGAELAKSVQKEISYWVKFGYAKQDVIDRLNRQFDVLIPALQSSNKDTARAAAYEMYKEIFSHHHRLSHHQFDYDHDEHESKPFYYKRKNGAHSQPSHEPPLHRVAARALGTNLMYLMTRLEIGR